jgi:hypothetical protein
MNQFKHKTSKTAYYIAYNRCEDEIFSFYMNILFHPITCPSIKTQLLRHPTEIIKKYNFKAIKLKF